MRFKIEVAFKQAVHTVGTYSYHFWMTAMTPITRRSGNQHLHRKSDTYRAQVRRKMRAYSCHLQTGVIAQGLLQMLSVQGEAPAAHHAVQVIMIAEVLPPSVEDGGDSQSSVEVVPTKRVPSVGVRNVENSRYSAKSAWRGALPENGQACGVRISQCRKVPALR